MGPRQLRSQHALRCRRSHRSLDQSDEVLGKRDDDYQPGCRVADTLAEVERPDYAPGVNQPCSDHHPNERSYRSQDLLRHLFLLGPQIN